MSDWTQKDEADLQKKLASKPPKPSLRALLKKDMADPGYAEWIAWRRSLTAREWYRVRLLD